MVNRAAGEQQGRFQRVMFQNMLVLLSLSIVLSVSDKTYPMYAISKQACLVVWVYNLAFFLVQDAVKVGCYKLMSLPCCEAFLSCIGARDDPVEEDEKKRHLLEANAA